VFFTIIIHKAFKHKQNTPTIQVSRGTVSLMQTCVLPMRRGGTNDCDSNLRATGIEFRQKDPRVNVPPISRLCIYYLYNARTTRYQVYIIYTLGVHWMDIKRTGRTRFVVTRTVTTIIVPIPIIYSQCINIIFVNGLIVLNSM